MRYERISKMAALTENAIKVAAIAAAIPFVGALAGFRLRFTQANDTSGSGGRRVYRVCELPVYCVADKGDGKCSIGQPYPQNAVEAGIGIVRKMIQNICEEFVQIVDSTAKVTARNSRTTSLTTYNYVRSNHEDISRYALVMGAGVGGFLFGRKSGVWRRLSYGLLCAAPTAIICYPYQLKELGALVQETWEEHCQWGQRSYEYSQDEYEEICKLPVLNTAESFDTISLSDFLEESSDSLTSALGKPPDSLRPIIEKSPDFLEPILEKSGPGDLLSSGNIEKLTAIEYCQLGRSERLGTADFSNVDNIKKLIMVSDCDGENEKGASPADCSCTMENSEGLDKVEDNHEGNIDRSSVADGGHGKEIEIKPFEGSTDQSNPEDKDMYNRRSS